MKREHTIICHSERSRLPGLQARGDPNEHGKSAKVFLFVFFLAFFLNPLSLYADTGPHKGGAGCAPGDEKITCSASYGTGCEQYSNSSQYYVGRWEGHGVQTDYTFCKGSKSTRDTWLLLKVAGFVLFAAASFFLLKKVHQKK